MLTLFTVMANVGKLSVSFAATGWLFEKMRMEYTKDDEENLTSRNQNLQRGENMAQRTTIVSHCGSFVGNGKLLGPRLVRTVAAFIQH